jgi:hypothetical protein
MRQIHRATVDVNSFLLAVSRPIMREDWIARLCRSFPYLAGRMGAGGMGAGGMGGRWDGRPVGWAAGAPR